MAAGGLTLEHAVVNMYLLIDRQSVGSAIMAATQENTAEKIVAAAERRMRESGFHGFSFRDIAADVGIKSASVHHHFPTKEHLGAAVAEAYTRRILEALGDPNDPERTPEALLELYVNGYRRGLQNEKQTCLGGVIASELASLPDHVTRAGAEYFLRSAAWLEAVLRRKSPRAKPEAIQAQAFRILALLQGGALIAKALHRKEAFELIAKSILE
jgi:TetR/AcrR family transcriptional regulator, transcriptional repressor for nem operon